MDIQEELNRLKAVTRDDDATAWAIRQASMFAAAGMTAAQTFVFAKIVARNALFWEDVQALAGQGVRIAIPGLVPFVPLGTAKEGK